MISLLTSKCQDIKLRGLQFQFIKQQKNGHFKFEDLPQALRDIRIKYEKAGGSSDPASLIPAYRYMDHRHFTS